VIKGANLIRQTIVRIKLAPFCGYLNASLPVKRYRQPLNMSRKNTQKTQKEVVRTSPFAPFCGRFYAFPLRDTACHTVAA
jgi:hypothetical protein